MNVTYGWKWNYPEAPETSTSAWPLYELELVFDLSHKSEFPSSIVYQFFVLMTALTAPTLLSVFTSHCQSVLHHFLCSIVETSSPFRKDSAPFPWETCLSTITKETRQPHYPTRDTSLPLLSERNCIVPQWHSQFPTSVNLRTVRWDLINFLFDSFTSRLFSPQILRRIGLQRNLG